MRNILTFLLLVNSGMVFSQCMIREISLEERVDKSALIVEGQIISSQAYKNESNMINTIHQVEIFQYFKGEQGPATIQVETKGGALETEIHKHYPTLELHSGEMGVLFLIPMEGKENTYKAYSGPQGFIAYDAVTQKAYDAFHTYDNVRESLHSVISEMSGETPVVLKKFTFTPVQHNKAAIITSIVPSNVTAGTKTIITINGSGFGAFRGPGFVAFQNASSGPATIQPNSAQYKAWTDNQIQLEVPSDAGTGSVIVSKGGITASPDDLIIQYAQLNVTTSGGVDFMADHINDNGKGGYSFQVNTSFASNSSALASFTRSLENWRNATCINWEISGNTTHNATSSDGINIVRFGNVGELDAGVLASTFSRYDFCNGGAVWFVGELDITYDPSVNWAFGPSSPKGSEFDIESVTIHELGHAHQLGHVINEADIMHFSIGPGQRKRDLGTNNVAGGNFVQAQSIAANACGPAPMTNHPECGATGIDNIEGSFRVFPNPANDFIMINGDGSLQNHKLLIIDYAGKTVLDQPLQENNNRIGTSHLPAGIYLLKVYNGTGEVYSSKLVLN